MATSTYGTPYVQGSGLVSAYPTVSSSLATRVDEVSYRGNGLNAQTGTTYTLVVGDAGKTITLSNASPVAVSLPQDSTADLPDGAVVTFYNLGAGTVTISQGTGATLQGGSITLAQFEVTSIIKLSANTYGRFDGAPAPGLNLMTPSSIANSGGSASATGGEITFTGVTTVSANGVFTSAYDAYRIIIRLTGSSDTTLAFRLRVAGSDAAGTDYQYEKFTVANTTVTGARSTAQTSAIIGNQNSTGASHHLELTGPALAAFTTFVNHNSYNGDATLSLTSGLHGLSTAYDGITLLPTAGNITGKVRMYGLKNS